MILTEVKSGSTVAGDWLGPLQRLAESIRETEKTRRAVEPRLVYGGDQAYARRGVQVIPWGRLHEHEW